MRLRGDRRLRQRGKPRQDQLVVLPERLLPEEAARIGLRNAPQCEGGRPHPVAEDDAGYLGRGLRPDMGSVGSRGRRADIGNPARILRQPVLLFLAHRAAVALGDEPELVELVELGEGHLVGDAAEHQRHAVRHGGSDAVPHLDRIGMDGDAAVRVERHPGARGIGAGAIVLDAAGDAGPDQDAIGSAGFLRRAVAPDGMGLELVEKLGRPHRDGPRIAVHREAAGPEQIAAAELDRIHAEFGRGLVDQRFESRHGLQRAVAAHRPGGHARGCARPPSSRRPWGCRRCRSPRCRRRPPRSRSNWRDRRRRAHGRRRRRSSCRSRGRCRSGSASRRRAA